MAALVVGVGGPHRRDVATSPFDGSLGVAVGIGPAAWLSAFDEPRVDGVGRLSSLELRADPGPVAS